MGIYELLSSKLDARKGSEVCEFNGYLEDYLDMVDGDSKIGEALKLLFELDNDLRVITKLQLSVSKESISNQIIRYKDIFKLKEKSIICPYIIYTKKDGVQKALLLADEDYIYVKGMYYSMTEPSSEFQEAKNDIVATDCKDLDVLKSAFEKLFVRRAGQIQRELDHKHFKDYDESYAHALDLSKEISESLAAKLEASEDKEAYIHSCISKWFLIKKFVYVQFMVDKQILNNRYEGNVKAQRNQAKINADSIRFVSISEMWKTKRENREGA